MVIKSHAQFRGLIEKFNLNKELESQIASVIENEVKSCVKENIIFYVNIDNLSEDLEEFIN